MKLFHSPTSPYVRKVMACAIQRGIDQQITLVAANPWESPAALTTANPLSKVPCLVTVDGLALFDSPVICEYLDSVGDATPMFPPKGGPRWRALKQQAIADGLLDAAVARRMEQAKPQEAARDAFMARQHAAVSRALDELERELPHRTPDIGTLAICCALGYLDFRFAQEPWRDGHPLLTAWYEAMRDLPALVKTAPPAT